ncbi:ABC transporter permease [Lysinibacillus sp. C5.1]|uniref:ABC transporter permease n=1 Tax=Lysinibacillus sp. C5.1 TaxID=2796169 RepID=UPI003081B772
MLLKELWFYFKKHKVITLGICIAMSSLLIILGTFFSFSSHLKNEINDLGIIYQDKKIYQLIDGYYEPQDFQNFFRSENSLESLKKFYNGLNENKNFQYLAMFDQHILAEVDTKDLSDKLQNNLGIESGMLEGREFLTIPSIQLNEQAMKYFNVEVIEGHAFTTEDFNNDKEYMNILLGSKYQGYYKLGDELWIDFYGKYMKVKVKGFLSTDSRIFYQNETEFYLKDFFVLPYLNYSNPINEEDAIFQKRVYFSMINGYIVTGDTGNQEKNMMDHVEILSKESGVEEYKFIGLNPHFQKYNGLMKSMEANAELVGIVLLLTIVITIVIINLILLIQQNKRLKKFAVHLLNGATKKQIIQQFLVEISIITFISYIMSNLILQYYLRIGGINIYIYLFVMSCLLLILSSIYPIYRLNRFGITNFLRYETHEEGK